MATNNAIQYTNVPRHRVLSESTDEVDNIIENTIALDNKKKSPVNTEKVVLLQEADDEQSKEAYNDKVVLLTDCEGGGIKKEHAEGKLTPAANAAAVNYIAHVDGLRTIAVTAVVIFHAWPEALPGGFIGVDIFFVISGYLISGIIFKQHQKKTFAYSDFYARRICRIYPSLVLMLAFTIVMSCMFFTPLALVNMSKTLFASTLFCANIQLEYQDQPYWGPDLKMNPLLHMWSLGVEEQYYIFWPMIAWHIVTYTRNSKRKGFFLLSLFLLFSFVFNVVSVHLDPKMGFYFPLSRFWQMTVGGIIAFRKLVQDGDSAQEMAGEIKLDVLRSVIGFTLIAVGFTTINETMTFPGWWAIIPTVAAALIITTSSNNPFNRYILGSSLFVFVGKISYPLYLWHWPLLVLSRVMYPGGGDEILAQPFTMVMGSIVLSIITYYGVENKVRHVRTKMVIGSLLASMFGISMLALVIQFNSSTMAWSYRSTSDNVVVAAGNTTYYTNETELCSMKIALPFDSSTAVNSGREPVVEEPTVEKIKGEIKYYDYPIEGEQLVGSTVTRLPNCGHYGLFANSTKGKHSVMIIGDSHGEAVWGRYRWLWNAAQRGQVTLNNKTLDAPSMYLWVGGGWTMMRCLGPNDEDFSGRANSVLSDIDRLRPDSVVMVFDYLHYLNENFPGPNPKGPPLKPDNAIPECGYGRNEPQTAADTEWLLRRWAKDVEWIISLNIPVTFVVANPELDAYVPSQMFDVNGVRRDHTSYNFSLSSYSNKPYLSFTVELMKAAGAKLIYLTDNMCWNDTCKVVTPKGYPIYADSNHFNTRFATEYLSVLDQTLPFSC